MASSVPGPATEQSRGRQAPRAGWWWLAAGTFIVGLVAGGLVVGFAGWGSSSATVVPVTTPAASTPPTTAPGVSGTPAATGTVTVNTACLSAINEAQQTFTTIGNLLSALKSLNPGQVDSVIRQLQPLESRLQNDLRACDVITRLPGGTLTTVTPGTSATVPVPTASAAPTS